MLEGFAIRQFIQYGIENVVFSRQLYLIDADLIMDELTALYPVTLAAILYVLTFSTLA